MFREIFMRSPVLALPIVALLIFIVVFAAVIVRTMNGRRRAHFEALARLPLDEREEAYRDH